jgi:hypothetical protein
VPTLSGAAKNRATNPRSKGPSARTSAHARDDLRERVNAIGPLVDAPSLVTMRKSRYPSRMFQSRVADGIPGVLKPAGVAELGEDRD